MMSAGPSGSVDAVPSNVIGLASSPEYGPEASAVGLEFWIVIAGEVSVLPKSTPSFGFTVKYHSSAFAVSIEETVIESFNAVCSTESLYHLISVPDSGFPSGSE